MSSTGLFLLLMWISCVCSTNLRYGARVKVKKEGISWFHFENGEHSFVKLIGSSGSNIIWMARDQSLYSIDSTQGFKPTAVNLNLCEDESQDNSCAYSVSLLTEGADGNLPFFCGSNDTNTKCCTLDSSYSLIDCFKLEHYKPSINEPALLVDNMLYFTLSEKGLYRINKNKNLNIWPSPTQAGLEQKYLKLIAGKDQQQDKIYAFLAEKVKGKDGEPEQWIPRVSQSCKNDRGGRKGQLQSSWTSMISTRLACGRGFDFTQLIDVAVLETNDDTKIYALFRNYWNMSAVCIYNMTEIVKIFTSSDFNSTNVPTNHRPGACVDDSTHLSNEVLAFMMKHPEMKNMVMPEKEPLLFRHRHYTHIQVDRVHDSTVLLLSLESGGIHKVLEKPVNQSVFVIAEYLPFSRGPNITSMLLHASQRLHVSSANAVVQIDLQACGVYGDECTECLLSRDPYCRWNGVHCTTAGKSADFLEIQTECRKPLASPSKTEISAQTPVVYVPPAAKHFLLCPMRSRHATYHWTHGQTHEECVHSNQGCLYLIDSMNETHEGFYQCVSSEDVYQRTVAQFQLSMSRSHGLRVAPALLLYSLTPLLLLRRITGL